LQNGSNHHRSISNSNHCPALVSITMNLIWWYHKVYRQTRFHKYNLQTFINWKKLDNDNLGQIKNYLILCKSWYAISEYFRPIKKLIWRHSMLNTSTYIDLKQGDFLIMYRMLRKCMNIVALIYFSKAILDSIWYKMACLIIR